MPCNCCLASIRVPVQSVQTNGWNLKYYKPCLKNADLNKSQNRFKFSKNSLLAAWRSNCSWVYTRPVKVCRKSEIWAVWCFGRPQSPFPNEKFLCSSLWKSDFPSQLSSRDRQASSLRAVGTEFTVHVFRDTTLPEKEQALMLWVVSYAIWPLLLLQKRQWLFVEYCI